MTDDVRERFKDRFFDIARDRVRRSLALLGADGGAPQAAMELHSMAGEAALLGFSDVAETARRAEIAARTHLLGECELLVRELARAVNAAVDDGPPPSTRPFFPASGPRPRTLVLSDSELVGEQLCDALDDSGVDARIAVDLESAARLTRTFAPDLVIAFCHLPDCSPDDVCAALRAHHPRGAPAILLVSEAPEHELAAAAERVGVDAYARWQSGLAAIVERAHGALAAPGRR